MNSDSEHTFCQPVFYRKKLCGLAKDLPSPFYLVSFGSIANVYTEADIDRIEEIVLKGGRQTKYSSYDEVISAFKSFCRIFHPDEAHTCLSSEYGVPLHRILHFFTEKDAANLDAFTMMFLPDAHRLITDDNAGRNVEQSSSVEKGILGIKAEEDDADVTIKTEEDDADLAIKNEENDANVAVKNEEDDEMSDNDKVSDVDEGSNRDANSDSQSLMDVDNASAGAGSDDEDDFAEPSFLDEWEGQSFHPRCTTFLQRGVPQPYYLLRTTGGWSFIFACRNDAISLFKRLLKRQVYGDFRPYTMAQLTALRNDNNISGSEHYYGLHGYYRFGVFGDRELALHFLQSETEDWHSSSMVVTRDFFKARQWAYQDHPALKDATHERLEIGLYADEF
ncbi:hypothetical protein ONZ45_g16296 [Pleurotus djamor]|nr:hypothetical protein ONZ45_g16296 [Pleurotus djamor]